MTQFPFVAEFHDIGKIIDWKAVGLQATDANGNPVEKEPHDFEKCDSPEWAVQFRAPIWEAVFRKAPEIIGTHYPHSSNWVLVSLADELAAGLGRIRDEAVIGHPQFGYYCLWTGRTMSDPRLKERTDLEELIAFLNENPSWEKVAQRYSKILHSRAETARPGLNVSTLYSHSVLAGRLFRVLHPLRTTLDRPISSYSDALKAFASQKLTVLFLSVLFPQRPFRTRDLSVFRQRHDDISKILSRYEDNVLVRYGENTLALFFSREEADTFIKDILDQGYLGLVRINEIKLKEMRSIGIEKALGREEWSSGTLPDQLKPPLCEGCQMDHGDRRWPADLLAERDDLSAQTRRYIRETPWQSLRIEDLPQTDRAKLAEWLEEWDEEDLCSRCFELRSQAEPLSKLASWQDGTVAWARIALNLETLVDALRQLHVTYIKDSAKQIQPNLLDNLPVRLPLIAGFVDDYQLFLSRWSARVLQAFGQDMVEQINEELLCVKLERRRETLRLLEIHREIMADCFPRMLDLDIAPVRFALSVSPVKHPFFVHWRYMERPVVAVGIQIIGGGTAEIPLNRLGAILHAIGRGDRRVLHRLRQIARTSRTLAEIVLGDRQDRDSKAFSQLKRILPFGMSFESLVTLANLAEG